MICPKCGSSNVNVQMVSESQLNAKRKGPIYWIFVGWWWVPIKWMCFFLPALIVKIFKPKQQKIKTTHKSMFVCQNCGNHWEA